MRTPLAETEPQSLMGELIELLGDFPPERGRSEGAVLALRLEDLGRRVRSQGAATEIVAAIQGARILLDLAELPPLPPLSAVR